MFVLCLWFDIFIFVLCGSVCILNYLCLFVCLIVLLCLHASQYTYASDERKFVHVHYILPLIFSHLPATLCTHTRSSLIAFASPINTEPTLHK